MIRKYRDADLEELLDAWYTASKKAHNFLDEDFFDVERKNIKSTYLSLAETWVYEKHGKVVGFIALIENEVGGIFVHSDYHSQGIGQNLMNYAASVRDGLVLNVFEENSMARKFYERYGFVKIGEVVHEQSSKKQIRMKFKG